MNGDKVLLLKKSKELFGGGKWNFPRGKKKEEETEEKCAIRETLEETGLEVSNLEKIGTLNFFKDKTSQKPDWIVHIFLTKKFKGKLKDSREGFLKWFDYNDLPLEEMWEDDKYWYKNILEKRNFVGKIRFLENFERVIEHEIEVI
jgi:8-oxo-dGTP pyrophosphatase MutT (NUDIX family)